MRATSAVILSKSLFRNRNSDYYRDANPSSDSVLPGRGRSLYVLSSERKPIVHLALARLDQRLRERDQYSVDRSSPSLPLYTTAPSD